MLTGSIGLGLENYNGIGQFRILDNGALIDPAGELDSVAFDNPIALGQAIANHPDFTSCLVKTLTRYARGRLNWEPKTRHECPGRGIRREWLSGEHRSDTSEPLFRRAGGPIEEGNSIVEPC